MWHMLVKAKRMLSFHVIYSPCEPQLEPELELLQESELEMKLGCTPMWDPHLPHYKRSQGLYSALCLQSCELHAPSVVVRTTLPLD